jgi:alpha-D-ribose 1-methylphosphonate 5-phosphate C-P lyase
MSAKTEKEIYKLCHYTNLQPLTIEDHKAKTIQDIKNKKG